MNELLERIQQVQDLPVRWLIEAIYRTTRYTDQQKEEAMRYVIENADIGETEGEEFEVIPEEWPNEVPATPSVPAEPVPA